MDKFFLWRISGAASKKFDKVHLSSTEDINLWNFSFLKENISELYLTSILTN